MDTARLNERFGAPGRIVFRGGFAGYPQGFRDAVAVRFANRHSLFTGFDVRVFALRYANFGGQFVLGLPDPAESRGAPPPPQDPSPLRGIQAPLSMEFPRQEYWSGLPFPSPAS